MKYITHHTGYTIVELLIVITVMGVVAVSAIGVIGNQQAQTELPQSVRDFESKLIDVANDTARGYYPDTGQAGEGRTCLASGTGISFTSGVSVQGGSRDCVFAGKALAFAPNGDVGEFAVLTTAARRLTRDGNPATSLTDFSSGDIAVADHLNSSLRLLYGLQVKSVRYNGTDIGALVFMSGFSNQEQRSGGVQLSGAPQTNLLAITGTSIGSPLSVTESAIRNLQFTEVTNDEGILICLERGDGGETAEISIGKDGRLLTTTAEFNIAC